MFKHLSKPWLLLPVSWAHTLSPKFLKYTYNWRPFTRSSRFSWQSLEWKGLKFRNPTGIAGGVDKNAENISAWWNLGVGFVEVGTVTPFAQTANPGVTVGRDLKLKALWNCLGFPNHGCMYVKKRLKKVPARGRLRPTPIFVNIGKNRWTKNEEAHEDYCYLMRELYTYADAFVINISSPNTSGLRDLFNADNFKKFLDPIFKTHAQLSDCPPLLLKLSPDLSEENLATVINSVIKTPICGLILTNTTQSRTKDMAFPTDRGGVSGEPLKQKSEEVLEKTISLLATNRNDFLLISTGGIMSKTDVQKRLTLGADLVQIYSALIFEGPGFFKHLSRNAAE